MKILDTIMKYIETLDLEDVKFEVDETKGIGTIQGYKDGARLNLTINLNPIKLDDRRKPIDNQIIYFLDQGYSQVQVASMLDVSQSYVSNVKRKYIEEQMYSGLGVNQSLIYNKDFTEMQDKTRMYLDNKEFIKSLRGWDNEEQESQE